MTYLPELAALHEKLVHESVVKSEAKKN